MATRMRKVAKKRMVHIVVRTGRRNVLRWEEARALDPKGMGDTQLVQATEAGEDEVDVTIAITAEHRSDLEASFGPELAAATLEAEMDSDAAVILARAENERELQSLPGFSDQMLQEGTLIVSWWLEAVAEVSRAVREHHDALGGVRLAIVKRSGDSMTTAVWLPPRLFKRTCETVASPIGSQSLGETLLYEILSACAEEDTGEHRPSARRCSGFSRELDEEIPF